MIKKPETLAELGDAVVSIDARLATIEEKLDEGNGLTKDSNNLKMVIILLVAVVELLKQSVILAQTMGAH